MHPCFTVEERNPGESLFLPKSHSWLATGCLEEIHTVYLRAEFRLGRKGFLIRDAWNGPELVPVTQCSLSHCDAYQMYRQGTDPGEDACGLGDQGLSHITTVTCWPQRQRQSRTREPTAALASNFPS